jgi:hypothetical protein
MCLWVSYKKKYDFFFFCILKVTEDPDPLVRSTDPGIQIRTKMSRIPITDPSVIKQKPKIVGKNPDFYCFTTSFLTFYL